jgi:hypothetical protein
MKKLAFTLFAIVSILIATAVLSDWWDGLIDCSDPPCGHWSCCLDHR